MTILARVLTALVGMLVLLTLSTPALSARPLVLVIDSSGSMAAEIDGEPRLDIARRVILERAAEWAAGADLGLVAYGHRRAGDCADIQTLWPPGPVDLDALAARLDALRARGKTPLSDALIAAAHLLPDGGSIILVSDGLETCAADPCAVARTLHDNGLDLRIFVVGFGLTGPELETLACIARNGGGATFSAGDAETLGQSLAAAAAAAVASQPAPVPEPELAVKEPAAAPPAEVMPPTPRPVGLVAMTAIGQVTAPVRWLVTAEGADVPAYDGAGRGIALELLPGRYHAKVSGTNVEGNATFEVPAGDDEMPIPVPLAAGHLQMHLVAGAGLSLAQAELGEDIAWTIDPLDGQLAPGAITGLDPSLVLMPGRYRIAAGLQGFVASAELRVSEGETLEQDLSLALGRLTMELVLDEAAGVVTEGRGLNWTVAPDDGGLPVTIAGTPRPSLVLPAGAYVIAATLDGATVSAPASMVDGQELVVRLSNAASEVTFQGSFGGVTPIEDWRYATWTVSPASGGAPVLAGVAEARPHLRLQPGEWDVTLVSGAVSTTQRVVVTPGGQQTITIDQPAGLLRLSGSLAGTPFADWRDVAWTVQSADGVQTLLAGLPELTPVVVAPAGDWRVTLVSGAAVAEQVVALTPGDDRMVAPDIVGGRISVTVPASDVARLKVLALDAGGNAVEPPVQLGAAAPVFASVLPPGQYIVEATTIDNRFASAPVEVTDGGAQTLELTPQ